MEQLYVPGVLRRHAARLIDQVICLVPFGLIYASNHAPSWLIRPEDGGMPNVLAVLLVVFVYEVATPLILGSTLGKWITSIRVVRYEYSMVGAVVDYTAKRLPAANAPRVVSQSAIVIRGLIWPEAVDIATSRWPAAILIATVGLLASELTMWFSQDNRSIHDRLTGTIVVTGRSPRSALKSPAPSKVQRVSPDSNVQPGPLTSGSAHRQSSFIQHQDTNDTEDIKSDNGGFKHYMESAAGQQALSARRPVTALCGWTWIPRRSAQVGDDLDDLPVCPRCKAIYDRLPDS